MLASQPQFKPFVGAVVVIGFIGAVVVGSAVVIGFGKH
jgi:hypothetical protein